MNNFQIFSLFLDSLFSYLCAKYKVPWWKRWGKNVWIAFLFQDWDTNWYQSLQKSLKNLKEIPSITWRPNDILSSVLDVTVQGLRRVTHKRDSWEWNHFYPKLNVHECLSLLLFTENHPRAMLYVFYASWHCHVARQCSTHARTRKMTPLHVVFSILP